MSTMKHLIRLKEKQPAKLLKWKIQSCIQRYSTHKTAEGCSWSRQPSWTTFVPRAPEVWLQTCVLVSHFDRLISSSAKIYTVYIYKEKPSQSIFPSLNTKSLYSSLLVAIFQSITSRQSCLSELCWNIREQMDTNPHFYLFFLFFSVMLPLLLLRNRILLSPHTSSHPSFLSAHLSLKNPACQPPLPLTTF